MANIYSSTEDGSIHHSDVGWSTTRDATTGSTDYSSLASFLNAVMARKGRGGRYLVNRAFFSFDTSSISVSPSEATLKIYGKTSNSADFFVVKSNQGGTLAVEDFDAIVGWSAGADNEGNVTKYSSEITSWSTSGYNDISLNSTALSDMSSLDTFQICLIESVHDLRNVAVSSGAYSTGMYFADETGTSKDPYIDWAVGAAPSVDNATFFGTNF